MSTRIERLVLDLQEFRGVVGHCGRLGYHRSHRLTLVANFGHCQRVIFDFGEGIRADLDKRLGLLRDLGTRQNADNAGKRLGGRGVNTDDLRVSIGRAHESQIEHLAQLDVVGKLAASAQQAILFLARKRFAYPAFISVVLRRAHCLVLIVN